MTAERTAKPRLLPVIAPWSVATVPSLKVYTSDGGQPESATFVAYFRLDDRGDASCGDAISYVSQPPEFEPATVIEPAAYRLVRITFTGGKYVRISPAASEHQTIAEAEYDWSGVPGSPRPGEDIVHTLERDADYWLRTGTSPDPGAYEIENSPWLAQLGQDGFGLRHYLILGEEEYVEVLAEGWAWEPGQVV